MNPIATLFVEIGADLDPLKKGLGGAESALGDFGSKLGGIALGVGVAGVAALAGGLALSVKAAMEAEEGQAQLAAVLASTSGKAGMTAESVNALASSLQDVTRFEDDAILAGQNMLLTFTNIGKDVFPMATETMLNMATAMGTDAKSQAIALGKALNDPTKGITALTRVGVTFTDAQKDMIKSLQEAGDIAGAQKIILAELETEFGGAARAAGDTFAGKLDILNNKFGDIMESIGGALIPILTMAADAFISLLGNPAIQTGLAWIQTAFATVADTVRRFFNFLKSGDFDDLDGVGTRLAESFGGSAQTIRTAIEAIGTGLRELGSIAAGIFSGGGGANPLGGLLESLQSSFQGLLDWILADYLPAIIDAWGQIGAAALPTLQMFAGWINETLLPALGALANWLGPILGAAFKALGGFITEQALPALTKIGVWIFEKGLPAFGDLANKVGGALNSAFKTAAELWGKLSKGFEDAVKFIDDAKTTMEELATALKTTVADAFLWFQDNVIKPINEALAGLAAYIQKVLDMLNKLGGWAGFGAPTPPTGAGNYGGANFSADRSSMFGGATRQNARSVQVNLTYAPTVSLMDEAEAETKLKPFVHAAVRAAVAG